MQKTNCNIQMQEFQKQAQQTNTNATNKQAKATKQALRKKKRENILHKTQCNSSYHFLMLKRTHVPTHGTQSQYVSC